MELLYFQDTELKKSQKFLSLSPTRFNPTPRQRKPTSCWSAPKLTMTSIKFARLSAWEQEKERWGTEGESWNEDHWSSMIKIRYEIWIPLKTHNDDFYLRSVFMKTMIFEVFADTIMLNQLVDHCKWIPLNNRSLWLFTGPYSCIQKFTRSWYHFCW